MYHHQGQQGENSGQFREVLGWFCTLIASYTLKVASLCNEVDLLVKQFADYADTKSLVPQRALPGSSPKRKITDRPK